MSLRAPPGRSADLEAVASVLDAPFGVAFLRGEPGSGKGSLASAWRASAATRGFLCGAARVPSAGGDSALAPLIGALMEALHGFEARADVLASLGVVAGSERVALGPLATHLSPPTACAALPFSWERLQLDRSRAFEAVAAAVRAVARVRPLALVLRGVEEAQPLLLEHLEYLVQVAAELPLSILVTAESDGRDAGVAATLELACERAAVRFVPVELAPLDDVFMEEILKSRYANGAFSDIFRERVFQAARGNPGLLGEVCLRLERTGSIFREDGDWFSAENNQWPFPEDGEAARLAPVMELAEGDYDVLEFLAATGGVFCDGLLSDPLLSGYLGTAERPLRKILGRLEEARILESVPGGWRFCDEVLRGSMRQASATSVRRRDLLVVADAMDRLPGGRTDRVAEVLEEVEALEAATAAHRKAALEWELAGAWKASAKALQRARELETQIGHEPGLEERIEYSRREGNAWHVVGAYDEAIAAYSAAIVPAELLDLHSKLAGLLVRRGDCYLQLGRVEEATEDFAGALEAAEETGKPRAIRFASLSAMRAANQANDAAMLAAARARAGTVADGIGPWLQLEEARGPAAGPDAAARLYELVDVPGVNPVLAARVSLTAASLLRQQGNPGAFQLASHSANLAGSCGDAATRAAALEIVAATGPASGADPDQIRAAWDELAALAGRLGKEELWMIASQAAGATCLSRGETARGVSHLTRASALAARRQDPGREARIQLLLGEANLALAKLYEAQSDFEAAARLTQELGDAVGYAQGLLGLGKVYARQRKRERARVILAQAQDAFSQLGDQARMAECGQALQELA